jgi:hypothetical protein
MTVLEVASVLRVAPSTAYAAVQRDQIPSIRVSGRIMVPTAGLRRLLQLDSGAERQEATRELLDTVDPDRELPERERLRRAESALNAYFTRLAPRSAQVRRRNKTR